MKNTIINEANLRSDIVLQEHNAKVASIDDQLNPINTQINWLDFISCLCMFIAGFIAGIYSCVSFKW